MITEALMHNGPALVEVPVSRQELANLFMLKAVLSGRGRRNHRSGEGQPLSLSGLLIGRQAGDIDFEPTTRRHEAAPGAERVAAGDRVRCTGGSHMVRWRLSHASTEAESAR